MSIQKRNLDPRIREAARTLAAHRATVGGRTRWSDSTPEERSQWGRGMAATKKLKRAERLAREDRNDT
jgi:hypothetical protein